MGYDHLQTQTPVSRLCLSSRRDLLSYFAPCHPAICQHPEKPVLDVHPPHSPTHTWKDFFIHIATITVGLLIAIGLEQSVEAIHQHHQREFLEEQMLQEAEGNLKVMKPQLEYSQHLIDGLLAREQNLNDAPPDGTGVKVIFPANSPSIPDVPILISPSRGTWTVAKAAGTIALLPPELAKVYARVDLAAEFEKSAEDDLSLKLMQLSTAVLKAHLPAKAAAPVRMSAAQRDELLVAYDEVCQAAKIFGFRLAILTGASEAVVSKAQTLEQMYPYQEQAVKALSPQQ